MLTPFQVSEEGTEAAAATGIILGLRIGIQRTQFAVDRPFGFIVYDFNQNIPLFMGKVLRLITANFDDNRIISPPL